jgi:diadenosine tetraphosphate (Ap4A) HIT family hydrolase
VIVLRRHLESVSDLVADEWVDLQNQMRTAASALKSAFDPAHFNYAFLQNQDRHVHLHVISRYTGTQMFAVENFPEADFPWPGDPKYLSTKLLGRVADVLWNKFENAG